MQELTTGRMNPCWRLSEAMRSDRIEYVEFGPLQRLVSHTQTAIHYAEYLISGSIFNLGTQ